MATVWKKISVVVRVVVLTAVPLFAVLSLAGMGFATADSGQSHRQDLRNCYNDCKAAFNAERAFCKTLSGTARRQCLKDARANRSQCRAQCKASFSHFSNTPFFGDDDLLDLEDAIALESSFTESDTADGSRADSEGGVRAPGNRQVRAGAPDSLIIPAVNRPSHSQGKAGSRGKAGR